MSITLRDTIKDTVKYHLLIAKGIAMGQCLTAVGWVGGTLPELYEEDGMVELSMADVAAGGFAVGAALAGRRPMYVIRYQGFNWFNAPIIINYAAKSKEIWGVPCPMFIRSIAMEGGIGPVAGSSHHSLYYRMPGIKIVSPMTPGEYRKAYLDFMNSDDVVYVSEHRAAYGNTEELPNIEYDLPDIVLYPISITRFAAIEASKELEKEGYKIAVHHLVNIKPFRPSDTDKMALIKARFGIVIDDDYVDGIAKSLAFDLLQGTNSKVYVMGLKDKSAGFYPQVDNLPPTKDEIMVKIKDILK
jgi:pyruvate/2-oxoglutarate/acetoin dehydrogenase E1 component